MRDDVVIAGAGPAGSMAACLLARAGVRVRLLDRATFPRDKLCGDTLNPGALDILRRLGVATDIAPRRHADSRHGRHRCGRCPRARRVRPGVRGVSLLRARPRLDARPAGGGGGRSSFETGVIVQEPLRRRVSGRACRA